MTIEIVVVQGKRLKINREWLILIQYEFCIPEIPDF